jgi:hypothetical protein
MRALWVLIPAVLPVRTAEEAASLLRQLAGRGAVRVFFERQGQIGSVAFTIAG